MLYEVITDAIVGHLDAGCFYAVFGDGDSVSTQLPPGKYEVDLVDGWQLEELDADGVRNNFV